MICKNAMDKKVCYELFRTETAQSYIAMIHTQVHFPNQGVSWALDPLPEEYRDRGGLAKGIRLHPSSATPKAIVIRHVSRVTYITLPKVK